MGADGGQNVTLWKPVQPFPTYSKQSSLLGQPGAACARAVHGAPSSQAWDMSDVLEASHDAFRENTEVTVLSVINQVLEFYSDSYYKTKIQKVIPMQSC